MAKNPQNTTGFDNRIVNQVLWEPHYKQALALECAAFELFFGGAAGGGKSDFLLLDFYAGVNEYKKHWRGILFRRTYDELEELHLRAQQIYLPLGAKLVNKGRDYLFPNGALIKFRYLELDKHVQRYQGHQYTWVGFDELGNYPTDYVWRYMIIRCRSAHGVPCYMRGSGNPGGVGHAWIKTRFVDGYEPYKIHNTVESSGAGSYPITRCFIPSTLEDNPTLMKNDPNYENRLKLLPTALYRAMRNGDWDIFAGQVFDEFRRNKHVIKPFALEPGVWKKFYSFDWGYSKPFSLGKWAVDSEGRMVRYGEWYGCEKGEVDVGVKMSTSEIAAKCWEMAVVEGVTEMIADTSMWAKDKDGPSKIEYFEKAGGEKTGFKCSQANKDRVNGLSIFHQRLKTLCGEKQVPMLQVFDHCVDFIRTIPVLTPDESNPEDVNSKLEDHIYDESRYAMMSDFAHSPVKWLRKQNGNWNFGTKRQGKSYDPYAYFEQRN